MIKKNLILAFSFATLISGAFADTCPRGPAVCMRVDSSYSGAPYVCTVVGNDGRWYQFASIIIPDNPTVINFPFNGAVSNSHQSPGCNYMDENHPNYGAVSFGTDAHLAADIHAANNQWRHFTISSYRCQGLSADACPFKAW